MKPIVKCYADVEYDAIENLLYKLKRDMRIREWIDMQDLYVDKNGDVYYVELYNYEYQREEGHGLHDVLTSVEPVEHILLLTSDEAKVYIEEYIEKIKAQKLPLIVKVGLVAVVFAVFIIIFNGNINAWVDAFAK